MPGRPILMGISSSTTTSTSLLALVFYGEVCGRVASKPQGFDFSRICDSLTEENALGVLTLKQQKEDGMRIFSFPSLTAGTLLAASLTAMTASAADLPRRAPVTAPAAVYTPV